ncbi:chlorophyll a/b-binding protein domain-containing protein [Baffinella frigidus]|nr:chlorophyll a/b-binding protein domain-containing protein [Cryptophyta sp. CCMP2293]
MVKRSFLLAAVALAGAEAFAPGSSLIRPPSSVRAGIANSPLRMQQSSWSSTVLDGTMPGDRGFDPLKFANSIPKLRIYREAELKHGRLAMLAAVGWPMAEQLNGPISKVMGLPSTLTSAGLDPSVLNGGLENTSPVYWLAVLAFATAIELFAVKRTPGLGSTLAALGLEKLTGKDIDGDGQVGEPTMLMAESYLPGDLGFDPLGLFKGTDKHKADLQLKELENGRWAMVAITFYAIQEAVLKMSVVSSLPAL